MRAKRASPTLGVTHSVYPKLGGLEQVRVGLLAGGAGAEPPAVRDRRYNPQSFYLCGLQLLYHARDTKFE